MSEWMASPQWHALRQELEALTRATRAFNAYVVDAWENLWCAAQAFDSASPEDLANLVRPEVQRQGVNLSRGGKLDVCMSGSKGHAYLRTYGSCYVLLLRFAGPFDCAAVRSAAVAALPRLELLTINLPPPRGPGGGANEAAGSA